MFAYFMPGRGDADMAYTQSDTQHCSQNPISVIV